MAHGQIMRPVAGIMGPVGDIFSVSEGRDGILTLLHGRAGRANILQLLPLPGHNILHPQAAFVHISCHTAVSQNYMAPGRYHVFTRP